MHMQTQDAHHGTLGGIRQSFDENGYVVVPDLIDAVTLAELRRRADGALDGRDGRFVDADIVYEPGLRDRTDLPRSRRIRVMFHLCHSDPWFMAHALRPAILDRVAALIGPEIVLYTDQLFVKNARHGTEVGWHQDAAFWPIDPPDIVSCWFAIDAATVENGCVRVVPGSHRRRLIHDRTEDPSGASFLCLREGDVDAAREVPVEVPAGGAMFHHALLAHRSPGNPSPHARRGLVSIYFSASTRLTRPWPFRHGFRIVRGRVGEPWG